MKLTIKDIARLAGVSTATVSMVINKKDERISAETKKRVLEVIEEYNYVPNRVASSMVTKNTKSLGLVLPDIANPFFPGLARGVEDRANKDNWNIILCNSDNDADKENRYLEMLQEKMVDGIILTSAKQDLSKASVLKKISVPIVTLDRDINDVQHVGLVKTDNVKGAYDAVRHMLDRGYRKILHLSGPLSVYTAQSRYKGYLQAYADSGVKHPKEDVFQGSFSYESGYTMTNALLEKGIEFDGLFCGNDLMAFGALKALAEHDICVPEVGVVGFDDIYFSALITPPLTTVHQPVYEMGYMAADVLINYIKGENKMKGKKMEFVLNLNTELVVRNTTR
jgi:LacI family transcriptional regulator